MENDLSYIHKKIESIESNMATKSDMSHFESRMSSVDNLADKLDRYAEAVNKLIVQSERRVESDKHRDKELERVRKLATETQLEVQLLKQKDAEKAPYYKMMERGLMALASALAVGVAVLVFK